jgi:hypothetical protein
MSIDAIVDKMLTFGETHLLGIGRGQLNFADFVGSHWRKDVGPLWAHNGPLPSIDELKKGGMVCIGLLTVLLRHVGQKLPYLDPKNFPEYAKYPKYQNPKNDNSWHSPYDEGIQFGFGDTSEWMYIYHYVKKTLKKFDPNGKYPKGTLLFRVFSPYDGGHVAILRESSVNKPLMDCTVLHTAGDSAGEGKVTMHETVRRTHEFYSRGKQWDWDKDNEFGFEFYDCKGNPFGYYTHVLLPKDYLDATDEGSMKVLNNNGGRNKMFKYKF